MSILSDLYRFLMSRKKYWMIPVILVLVIIGGLLLLAQASILAPFIYTLF